MLKQLSQNSCTENTITFLADNGGMLQSCKAVIDLHRDWSEEVREWLKKNVPNSVFNMPGVSREQVGFSSFFSRRMKGAIAMISS